MEILAHIRKKDGEKQSMVDHLKGVAEKSRKFASKIGLGEQGELIGLLHDLGKYSKEFQRYLKSAGGMINPDEDDYIDAQGMRGKIDHSTAGAQFLFMRLSENGKEAGLVAQFLSLCICSHHSGLIDCLSPDGTDAFTSRIKKSGSRTHYDEAISNLHEDVLKRLEEILSSSETGDALIRILKEIHVQEEESQITTYFKQGLLIRFLFSCLIDADRLDSADFEEPQFAGLRNNGRYIPWDELILRLEDKLGTFKQENKVDKLRKEISDECRNFANRSKGIYLLTVPTGGGKTLASLRFALYHAKANNMDRIIYIIPYTSIIDQNAAVVKKFLEDRDTDGTYLNRVVLEHHSNLTPDEETWQQKLLSQDWDCPIVFTTSVQILETLFGSGTRSTRRMHQLSRSVIIFDEVQTIPLRCVHMFNNAINFLVRNCGSTIILCTATQPLLNNVDRKKGAVDLAPDREIMLDPARLFTELKRVEVKDKRKVGGWSSDEVAGLAVNEVSDSGSALVIVNTRKAAKDLYEKCRQTIKADIFHLSTNMCPAHRMEVLAGVRSCLDERNPKPLLCVSTQLVEAGVDVDFGTVIRYVAGLDSIAQAAGRCNRNGLRPTGQVFIVNPDFENLDKLKDIKMGKEKAERVLDEYRRNPAQFEYDILGPKAIERYFQYYFYQQASEMNYPVGKKSILGRDDNLLSLLSTNSLTVEDYKRINGCAPQVSIRGSFMTAAKIFKSIDSPSQGIIVPYKEGRIFIGELCATNDIKKLYQLIRAAQRYSVNVFPNELEMLKKEGAIYQAGKGIGIYYLDEKYYSPDFGLSMSIVSKDLFISA